MSILAIDAGTTGVTALVVTPEGTIAAKGYQEFPQHFPKPGWVEHAPEEIWQATLEAMRDCLQAWDGSTGDLQGIGITNQRETVLLWDRETLGSPRRAIVWQDRRTADICRRLREEGHEDRVAELTGLRLDPYFSGTKLVWLAENEPNTWALVKDGRYAIGTVDSYLIARMTRGTWHVTDVSNACRTLLFDLETGAWSRGAVRPVRRADGRAARDRAQLGRARDAPTRRASSTWSCRSPGSPATSSRRCSARPASTWATPSAPTAPARSSSTNTGTEVVRSDAGLLSTAAWRSPDGELTYALEGAIFVTGAAVQWLRDGLQIVGSAAETAGDRLDRRQHRRRGVRPGADRPRRPALGPARPRHDPRHHAGHDARPHRPRHPRGDHLRGARRHRHDADRADLADGRRRRRGQRPALPAPGRPARRTRAAAGDRRDHRPRRRVHGRPRHRRVGVDRRPARDLEAGPRVHARTGPTEVTERTEAAYALWQKGVERSRDWAE